jgi:hypothetical protein
VLRHNLDELVGSAPEQPRSCLVQRNELAWTEVVAIAQASHNEGQHERGPRQDFLAAVRARRVLFRGSQAAARPRPQLLVQRLVALALQQHASGGGGGSSATPLRAV